MSPASWIKNALERQAKACESKFVDKTFLVLHECFNVDFITSEDEIPIVISDESGLQIFAIFTSAQKLKFLSEHNSSAGDLEQLLLHCLEYRLDIRQKTSEHDVGPDNICMPGVDYHIVIMLLEVEKIDGKGPFAEKEKLIRNRWLRFWYYECSECKVFASTIMKQLTTSAAKENPDHGETYKDPQTLPLKSIRESQEPEWTDSITMPYSDCSEDTPEWLVHDKPISIKMDVHPSSSRPITEISGKMENRRLNELMHTSKLSIDLLDQPLMEHRSPGIVMDTKELLDMAQSNLPCVDVNQDMSTQNLSTIANLSKTSCPPSELGVDFTLTADTCASLTLTTDQDVNLSPIALSHSDAVHTTTNQDCEKSESVCMDQREDCVDKSEAVHTLLNHEDPTEVSRLSDATFADGNVNAILKNDAVNRNQINKLGLTKRTEEDDIDQDNVKNSNANLANSHADVSNTNLDHLNLAEHTDQKVNDTLTNCVISSSTAQTMSALRDKDEKLAFPLDKSSHANPLYQQPSDIQQFGGISYRKKKKIKKIHGTVMYPIPNPNNIKMFDKYLCPSTFFLMTNNDDSSDSDRDTHDDLNEACKNGAHKELGYVTNGLLAHVVATIPQQNQIKLYTNPVVDDEFRNGLVQHLACSSDSDQSEITKVQDESRKTEMRTELSSRKRYIHGKHKPNDLSMSPTFKNKLLKYIYEDV